MWSDRAASERKNGKAGALWIHLHTRICKHLGSSDSETKTECDTISGKSWSEKTRSAKETEARKIRCQPGVACASISNVRMRGEYV